MNGLLFTEIYTERDGCRQAFVDITKLLKNPSTKTNERWIFQPNVKNKIINRSDGRLSVVVRIRFVNAIAKSGDNVERIGMLLEQVFNPEAIKFLFPDMWLAINNARAARQHRRDLHAYRVERAHKTGRFDPVHREVEAVVKNGSVRKFAKSSVL